MPATLIPAGNLWHVLYNGEPAALNVNHEEATRLLDLYDYTDAAITREFGERGERFEAEWK